MRATNSLNQYSAVNPCYDANGNITQKLDNSGNVVMNVAYDPFGNVISGALTGEYGFSTKPLVQGIDWYYYGFRYYDPVTGRWPSRDPIAEQGGLNLYGFGPNNPVNGWDYLGGEWSTGNPLDFESETFDKLLDFLKGLLSYSKYRAKVCIKCTATCAITTLAGEVVSDELKNKIEAELDRAVGLGKETKYTKTFTGIERKIRVLKKVGKAVSPVTKVITVKEIGECSYSCMKSNK